MKGGRVLGLDHGRERVGVAISDPSRLIAQPLTVIPGRGPELERRIRELVAEWEPDLIVVGLPVGLSGREGPAARAARDFGDAVAEVTGLPIEYWDERFTTTVAERALLESGARRSRRRQVRDKLAAAVMLQSYLDRQRNDDGPDDHPPP